MTNHLSIGGAVCLLCTVDMGNCSLCIGDMSSQLSVVYSEMARQLSVYGDMTSQLSIRYTTNMPSYYYYRLMKHKSRIILLLPYSENYI